LDEWSSEVVALLGGPCLEVILGVNFVSSF